MKKFIPGFLIVTAVSLPALLATYLVFTSCNTRIVSDPDIWRNPNVSSHYQPLDVVIDIYMRYMEGSEIKRTPLVYMKSLSELSNKQVYLKDDSSQACGSFKIRGVIAQVDASVQWRMDSMFINRDLCIEPFYLVTQTSGNHGAAMIEATRASIEKYKKLAGGDPEIIEGLNRIEPVVFASKNTARVKISMMEKMLNLYRQSVGHESRGWVNESGANYEEARNAREKFMKDHQDDALYMKHGGITIMAGYAAGGMEVGEQLKEAGIGPEKKVALIVPVALGGPVGIGAGFKRIIKNSSIVLVQTRPYASFVRTLQTGEVQYNDPSPPPTIYINGNPIVFEDGIAGDTGEPDAVLTAKVIVDEALIVDPQKNLFRAAPIIYRDLARVHGEDKTVVGGTTAATGEALLEHLENPKSQSIKDADVIVLYGTEGNINPDLAAFIKNLAAVSGN